MVAVLVFAAPLMAQPMGRGAKDRDVGQRGRQPFLRNVSFQKIPPNQSSVSGSIRIPAGKRLVTEFVTLYGFSQISVTYRSGTDNVEHELGGPKIVQLFINSTVNGYSGTSAVLIAGKTSGPNRLNYWNLVQPLRIYADSGKPVTVKIQGLSRFGPEAYFLVTVSGYLVDAGK
ncbi:MAG TPA: hypothetical protein VE082_01735 [Desulfobaccales bacterium]|nr:hypothetical protein [Desulfobaccales bacterium]